MKEGPVRFLHVDCDLYSSTKTIFGGLNNRLQMGTVILFDEFFNYPGWQSGEYKAWRELCEEMHLQFEYLGYCHWDEQVAVRITGIDGVTNN